jgi:mevalonate kinase
MGRGFGFGKVILFNEHFVVYGIPGIVSAIDSTAYSEVRKRGRGITLRDERTGALGYTEKKRTQQEESIHRMLKVLDVNPNDISLDILLGGTLPGFSGIGASAASSVAIARAISEELELDLSNERINEVAFEAEKAYAGNPSGIDNTAATYGGLIWFKKATGADEIERLSLREPVGIVIGNTGTIADTKEMVSGVAARRRENPQKYDWLFEQSAELVHRARKALETFDLRRVGNLMNENHRLLKEIEVSSKALDTLVELARSNGALGAKLTGGGGGGCMVALTPGEALQNKVASAIENGGFETLKTRIATQTPRKRGW